MMTAMLTAPQHRGGPPRLRHLGGQRGCRAQYHEAGDEGEQAALASERLVPKRLKAA